ncbi:hypothetical protein DPMN_124775 [Dreissena polymorpha]|uniref:Uncharacterized protein n=1 Tax=Dreissena polymorpha TaxID=45954 RepID=A0A9D4JSV8_DREPO|nr:hypothetical protein DPMN_124775 [Dreissena polymorpha]
MQKSVTMALNLSNLGLPPKNERVSKKIPTKKETPRKFPLLRAADPFPQSSVRALVTDGRTDRRSTNHKSPPVKQVGD